MHFVVKVFLFSGCGANKMTFEIVNVTLRLNYILAIVQVAPITELSEHSRENKTVSFTLQSHRVKISISSCLPLLPPRSWASRVSRRRSRPASSPVGPRRPPTPGRRPRTRRTTTRRN